MNLDRLPRLHRLRSPRITAPLVLQWVQIAAFAWVLWLPVSQGLILYPALALLFVTSLALVVIERPKLPHRLKLAAVIYFTYVVVWSLYSLWLHNPGVAHQSALWLGVPVIWGTWSLTLSGAHARRTIATIVYVALLSSSIVVAYGFTALGGPNLPAWLLDLQQMRFTKSSDGEIEMAYLGLSSLLPMSAVVIAAALIPSADAWMPRRSWVVPLTAILAGVAGTVSGRRGLTLIVFVALALAVGYVAVLILLGRFPRRLKLAFLGRLTVTACVVLALIASPLGANLKGLVRDLSAVARVSTSDHSALAPEVAPEPNSAPAPKAVPEPSGQISDEDGVRIQQASALVTEWRSSPILGRGFGAVLSSGYRRSEDRPWVFENQPLQVAMNIGILGLAVLLVLALILGGLVVSALRSGHHRVALVASAVGWIAIIIADATNPYLQAPAHGWAVFLLLAVCLGILSKYSNDSRVNRRHLQRGLRQRRT